MLERELGRGKHVGEELLEQELAHPAARLRRPEHLLEALEITTALLHAHPEWSARRAFVDRIASELTI